MNNYLYPVVALTALCFFLAKNVNADVFVEQNGLLIIEAESSGAPGEWDLERSIGGYAGSGYLLWNGSDAFAVSSAGRGTITYRFVIERAGNYELLWRSRITKGNNQTEHNDSWVRFPTGRDIPGEQALNGWTKVFMSTLNRWAWQSATVDHVGRKVRQYFPAGEHTLQISGRSNGHAIDRIALYHYSTVGFNENQWNSTSQSPTRNGSSTPVVNNPPEPAPEPAPQPEPIPQPEPAPVPQPEPVPEPQPAPQPQPVPEPDPTPTPENSPSADDPNQVSAPVLSASGSRLEWSAVDAVAYNVHRGDGTWLVSLPATQTNWQAPDAGDFFVVATGAGPWQTWGRSDTVTVSDMGNDSSGQGGLNLRAEVYSSSALELFWTELSDKELSYEIRRNGHLVTITDGRSYFNENLQADTDYLFSVTSFDLDGNEVGSASVNIKTQSGFAEPDPGGLQLSAEVYSQSAVEIFWQYPSNLAPGYEFQVFENGVLVATTDGRSYFKEGLIASSLVSYTIVAVNSAGMTGLSESVAVETYPPDSQ